MRETLRWIGYLIVTTFVLIALVFTAYRIRGPSRAQRDALALMRKDYRPQQGVNAFPLLWYVEYDVPDDEVAKRYAAEVASAGPELTADFGSQRAPAATKLTEADGDPARLCDRTGAGCLAKVRAEPEAMRVALSTYPVIRRRAKAFEATDYYWNDFRADEAASLTAVPTKAQRIWLSTFALEYVDGDRARALADTCVNLAAWRRLHRGTNSLIGSMSAISSADSAMRLFADMLAALPDGETAPDACVQALRPIEAADVDRCAEMAGEFAFNRDRFAELFARPRDAAPSWHERAGTWLAIDVTQWEGWMAEQDARYCEEPPARMLADLPPTAPIVRNTERVECISSVIACMMADIAAPAFENYDERTLDYAAHVRLAATLLWLRETAGAGPLARRLDARPDALVSRNHRAGYDAQSRALFVDNMHGSRDEPFRLAIADPPDNGR